MGFHHGTIVSGKSLGIFAGLLFVFCPMIASGQGDPGLYWLELGSRFNELEQAAQKRLSALPTRTASQVGPLCVALARLKKYQQLFECAAELEARIRQGDKTIEPDAAIARATGAAVDATAMPDMLRAEALVDLGQYAESIRIGEKALDTVADRYNMGIWPPDRYRIVILSNLALATAFSGRQDDAKRYLARLNDLSFAFFSATALLRGYRREGNARVLVALGAYPKALEYLDELEGRSGGWSLLRAGADLISGSAARGDSLISTTEIPWLVMRGKVYSELGDLKNAKLALNEVLAHARIGDFGDLAWIALDERGRIAGKENAPAEAIEYYKKSIEIFEKQRSSINSEASKIGFVGNKQTVYERLVALLVEQQRAAEAFDYVERSKARALVDMLASKKDFAGPAIDPEKARSILAQLDVADTASRSQAAGTESKESGARSLDAARREIQRAAPELSTLVTVTSVPPEELKALIGENEALVEYYYQGKDLYAFLLNKTRLTPFKLSAEGITDEVQEFRSALQHPGSTAWQTAAKTLHKRLWQPIESSIGARNVIVVAHGALHYLPFAALQAPDGKLIIDQYSLRFLPSASVLSFLRAPLPGKEGSVLALGNPDLGDPSKDLRFAEVEARAIADLFPQSRLLLRKEASETNFKKAGGVFSRIHFATHGQFQADDPLSSGLFLAGDGDNDGILTVSELYSMTLDADLITLSACETGLGKIANGDDVVGLTRGFLYAGSRSIVASLWSVEDKATAALMSAFYENLPKLSKREALREAQLKTRQDFPHPFFWAAFQLTGRAD
jgi:CHAT domain-containing protein